MGVDQMKAGRSYGGSSLWGPRGALAEAAASGGLRRASAQQASAGSQAASSQTAYGPAPAPIKESSLIKFTAVAPRRADFTPEAFHKRWLLVHGPLAVKYQGALRWKRYVQSHLIDSPTIDSFSRGRNWTPNPYDGLVELWWESEEDMAAAFASPEGQDASAILAEDERAFCDNRIIVFMTREYEIFKSPDFHF
jgi:uncharacterized protein (TIGR02118 family)